MAIPAPAPEPAPLPPAPAPQLHIDFQPAADTVTVDFGHRTIRTYRVADQELHALSAPSSSPSLALFGVMIGVTATCVATLASTDITAPVTKAAFTIGVCAFFVLSLFFGWQAVREWRRARAVVQQLRTGP